MYLKTSLSKSRKLFCLALTPAHCRHCAPLSILLNFIFHRVTSDSSYFCQITSLVLILTTRPGHYEVVSCNYETVTIGCLFCFNFCECNALDDIKKNEESSFCRLSNPQRVTSTWILFSHVLCLGDEWDQHFLKLGSVE